MTTAEKAFYLDPSNPDLPITVGDWCEHGDSFYRAAFAAPHPEAPHVAYRVMLRTGVIHRDVPGVLSAYLNDNPALSFRRCMVSPPTSFEEHIKARRAQEGAADRPQPNYASLKRVLDAAFAQSAEGKGKARHGNGLDFDQQPIMKIGRMVGTGYPVGQAMKKGQEAIGMARRGEHDAAKAELLGVIVYAAAAYLLLEEAD